jgi:hypothetical protein
MTDKQKMIRNAIAEHGSVKFNVGKEGIATMATIKCLLKDGYLVRALPNQFYEVSK